MIGNDNNPGFCSLLTFVLWHTLVLVFTALFFWLSHFFTMSIVQNLKYKISFAPSQPHYPHNGIGFNIFSEEANLSSFVSVDPSANHSEGQTAWDSVVFRDSYGRPDRGGKLFLHQMLLTQAASLCANDSYPVNSCSTGSRFISLQTDSTKNEFRPKLRGVTVWALYLNSKQHSRGHNFQPAGKEANLPISYKMCSL